MALQAKPGAAAAASTVVPAPAADLSPRAAHLAILRLLVVTLPPSLLSALPFGRTWDLMHYVLLELSVLALFRTLLGLPDPTRLVAAGASPETTRNVVVPPPPPPAPTNVTIVVPEPTTAAAHAPAAVAAIDDEDEGSDDDDDASDTEDAPAPVDEEVDLGKDDDTTVPVHHHPLLKLCDPLVAKLLAMTAMGDAAADANDWDLVVDRGDAVKIWRSKHNEHRYRLLGIFDAPLYTTFDFLNDIEKRPEWDDMTEGASIVEQLSPTTRVQHIKIKAIWPTSARDLLLLSHWRRLSPSTMLACTTSVDHTSVPEAPGVVRMWAECAGQLCERVVVNGIEKTRVLQIADGDPKGWVPKSILTMVATKALPDSFIKVNRLVSQLPHATTSRYFPVPPPKKGKKGKKAKTVAPPPPPPPAPAVKTVETPTTPLVTAPAPVAVRTSWLAPWKAALKTVHRVLTGASPYLVSAMAVMMIVQRLKRIQG
ncbi:hypothetical protein AMAG_08229 [Allomyces macrogynus ATCC 38327]|uniref:START domain-containing protein n=1 Tax=Allomyces macrogynus (strain ATCC 38327) TaxID=578462 RepID=A0A0L0SKV0_ALLM3|nr:hypothetical protein AMAG_08229 [Allomyces macrogynus ATCC 38327]|eukprot:KNE63063.1 hypothetical protein AMAG_08229 [Allomyces macrogynus ATCC 38327]